MIDEANLKNKILKKPDNVAYLHKDEILGILRTVTPHFEEEKALIELDGKIAFIGDIHGDFSIMKAIVKQFFDYDHLVFLGDYIDREPVKWGSIHTITYLLLLKCCFPKKIILLKGNHECNYLIPCFPYQFKDELFQRFRSSELHTGFTKAFSEMPLMVLSHRIFAAHGGIIKGVDLQGLKKIEKNDTTAVEALVWSDPTLSRIYRGIGSRFDKEELLKFLEEIQANVFIRGHDYTTLGFSIYNDRCLTIFSSSEFKEEGNGGILAAWTEQEISRVKDINVEDFSNGQWRNYTVKRK